MNPTLLAVYLEELLQHYFKTLFWRVCWGEGGVGGTTKNLVKIKLTIKLYSDGA